jgi:hypothetical protein
MKAAAATVEGGGKKGKGATGKSIFKTDKNSLKQNLYFRNTTSSISKC